MNCDRPVIAVRRAGINPATGSGYKPHTFIKWRGDESFTRAYFHLKRFERDVNVCFTLVDKDLFTGQEYEYLQRVRQQESEVLLMPCGKCYQCVQSHRRAWSIRCINEAQLSNGGIFLTLTCSDESIERIFPGRSLDHRPFQLFMKRLRKHKDKLKCLKPGYDLRYFMCGEYGEEKGRPHYHAIIFGYDFPNRVFVGRSRTGAPLYNSPLLDELRYDDKGREIFGPVSNFSDASPYDISYTCGYVDKKLGNLDPTYYTRLEYSSPDDADFSSGNLQVSRFPGVIGHKLMPEYVRMSRRPGIGAAWIRQYHGDVWKFYNDLCLSDRINYYGTVYQTPRYYFDQAKISGCISSEKCDIIKAHRRNGTSLVSSDPGLFLESLKRAHDREYIKLQQLSSKVRRQF